MMSFSDLGFSRISLSDFRNDTPIEFIWRECVAQPAFQRDDVHIWLVNTDRASWQPDVLRQVLSEDEKARAARFYFEDDRSRYIVRRAVLRRLIGQYLQKGPGEIEFTQNSFGKPELATTAGDPGFRFNLSASGEWAIGVFTHRRTVGIDIEKVRQDLDWAEIAARFFHPREVECINELPGSERVGAFFRYWTMKEAFIKARGAGLQRSLLEIDFTPVVRAGEKSYSDTDGMEWLCASFIPGERLVAALVVQS